MPLLELDTPLVAQYDRVRSHARVRQLQTLMAREHTADLMDENRRLQREARTLLEPARRLTSYCSPLHARAERTGTA